MTSTGRFNNANALTTEKLNWRVQHIGLAGWRKRVKLRDGRILMAKCGLEILWREWALLILTGKMRESSKFDGGMRDENQKNLSLPES